MNNAPEVSILMPTFNAVRYIDEAILSVLSDHFQNWELLVCDDSSNDGTYEKIKFWENQDERITVMRPHNEKGHFIDNCNIMLNESRGRLVARLDADDISLPGRLEAEIAFLDHKPKAVYVGGLALTLMEEQGNHLTKDYPWLKYMVYPVASADQPINKWLSIMNPIVHSTVLGRRNEMLETGGYDDLAPSEDWDMALMLASIGEVYVLPKLLCIKRQHSANMTRDNHKAEDAFQRLRLKHGLAIEKRIRDDEMPTILGGLAIGESR